MITRIVSFAALVVMMGTTTATAAASVRLTAKELTSAERRRKLSERDYFCDCPCRSDDLDSEDENLDSTAVWVVADDTMRQVMRTRGFVDEYFTETNAADYVTMGYADDEDGVEMEYYGLCLVDDDVFDLLYDYGQETWCDDYCVDAVDGGDDAVDTDQAIADEEIALEFDFDNNGIVNATDMALDWEGGEGDKKLDGDNIDSSSSDEDDVYDNGDDWYGESNYINGDDWYVSEDSNSRRG